jgi:hypothetical protein
MMIEKVSIFVYMGELVSLILLIVSTGILIASSYRLKSWKALESQLTIFFLIFSLGEIPRILDTTKIIDVGELRNIGLLVHTFSMVFIGSLVIYKWYIYLGEERRLDRFNQLLYNAINMSLTGYLDERSFRLFKFYFDLDIALKDPKKFSRSINRMFGDMGKDILSSICEILYKNLGLKKPKDKSFEECIEEAREKYMWEKL